MIEQTVEQRVKAQIGEMVVQIISLQAQVEEKDKKIAEMMKAHEEK